MCARPVDPSIVHGPASDFRRLSPSRLTLDLDVLVAGRQLDPDDALPSSSEQ